MSVLRLATRRSPLALAQAERVRRALLARGVEVEVVGVETHGDRDRSRPLATMGGQGVFARAIQDDLLEGRADVAVHSAKDLPSVTPDGLVIAAVPEREDAADALIGATLDDLAPGARVATGSPRRRALLLERRPDLTVLELRGNMATRFAAVGADGVAAVVVAVAALARLGETGRIAERLDPEWFLPQVAQGAIALECRADDVATRTLLASLDDEAASRAVRAERSFLAELGAGCSVPVGAHAEVIGDEIRLRGLMASRDGRTVLRSRVVGGDEVGLGRALARELRDERGGSRLAGWDGA